MVLPSDLKQQGHIEDDGFDAIVATITCDLCLDPLQYAGMNESVQPRQLPGIRKNQPRQFLSVDSTGTVKDLRTEAPDNFIANRAGFEHGVSDCIGVDDGAAQLAEFRCDRALAGSNSTNDSYHWLFSWIAHLYVFCAHSRFSLSLYRSIR